MSEINLFGVLMAMKSYNLNPENAAHMIVPHFQKDRQNILLNTRGVTL